MNFNAEKRDDEIVGSRWFSFIRHLFRLNEYHLWMLYSSINGWRRDSNDKSFAFTRESVWENSSYWGNWEYSTCKRSDVIKSLWIKMYASLLTKTDIWERKSRFSFQSRSTWNLRFSRQNYRWMPVFHARIDAQMPLLDHFEVFNGHLKDDFSLSSLLIECFLCSVMPS
jgi:hypothetical protein